MDQNERVAKLETRLESLIDGLDRIEPKLDAYTTNFLTKSEADLRFQNVEREIKEVKENKKANNAIAVSCAALVVTFIFSLLNYLK